MTYFIFNPIENITGTLFKIAENQNDLNNLNIILSNYKIIEDSQENFDSVKYGTKTAISYSGNTILYVDTNVTFQNYNSLFSSIVNAKQAIKNFLDNNKTSVSYNLWNDYYSQLSSFNVNSLSYPFNKSLEQYFKEQGLISLNTLQLP